MIKEINKLNEFNFTSLRYENSLNTQQQQQPIQINKKLLTSNNIIIHTEQNQQSQKGLDKYNFIKIQQQEQQTKNLLLSSSSAVVVTASAADIEGVEKTKVVNYHHNQQEQQYYLEQLHQQQEDLSLLEEVIELQKESMLLQQQHMLSSTSSPPPSSSSASSIIDNEFSWHLKNQDSIEIIDNQEYIFSPILLLNEEQNIQKQEKLNFEQSNNNSSTLSMNNYLNDPIYNYFTCNENSENERVDITKYQNKEEEEKQQQQLEEEQLKFLDNLLINYCNSNNIDTCNSNDNDVIDDENDLVKETIRDLEYFNKFIKFGEDLKLREELLLNEHQFEQRDMLDEIDEEHEEEVEDEITNEHFNKKNNNLYLYNDKMFSSSYCINNDLNSNNIISNNNICNDNSFKPFFDDDITMETVKNFSDIILKNDDININNDNIKDEKNNNNNDDAGNNLEKTNFNNIINKEIITNNNHNIDNNKLIIKNEHNYTVKAVAEAEGKTILTKIKTTKHMVKDINIVTNINNNVDNKNKQISNINNNKKVPPLKLKIPKRTTIMAGVSGVSTLASTAFNTNICDVSTPEIMATILDMQDEKCDLIKYITSDNIKDSTMTNEEDEDLENLEEEEQHCNDVKMHINTVDNLTNDCTYEYESDSDDEDTKPLVENLLKRPFSSVTTTTNTAITPKRRKRTFSFTSCSLSPYFDDSRQPSSVQSTITNDSDVSFRTATTSTSSSSTNYRKLISKSVRSDESRRSIASTSTGTTTATSSPATPAKKRGRPPKQCNMTPLSPSQFSHMNEEDFKYFEMRNKNNEASRRSRQNRKERECKFETEANELNKKHRELLIKEKSLIRQRNRLKAYLAKQVKN